MSTRAILLSCAVTLVGAYMVGTEVPLGAPRQDSAMTAPSPSLPPATQALAGIWEGRFAERATVRLVVEDVRSEWASVLFAWETPEPGGAPAGWMRTRAKVLAGGRLHLSYPLHVTFTLSDDHANVVGTRGRMDPSSSVLLSRVASDTVSAHLLPLPDEM
jgi:hypothetical protein